MKKIKKGVISPLVHIDVVGVFAVKTAGCVARFRRFHRASRSPSRMLSHEDATSPRASDSVHSTDANT